MWESLTWGRLADPDLAGDVSVLREDSLRFFVRVAAAGFLLWHFTTLLLISQRGVSIEEELRYWALFVIAVIGLATTDRLLGRRSDLAIVCFLVSSALSIIVAAMLLDSPLVTLFFPFLAMTAVVLLNPLAGLVVGMGSLGLLLVLWQVGPLAFLSADRLVETGIESLLAVAVSWMLGHNLVTSVEWTLSSYTRAVKNTRLAQQHRAELAQALKQLDNAYYRLERMNAALELAWKAAEAAERSRAEFAANISHELRTPLNLIVGFIEMMVTCPESYGAPLPAVYRGDLNAVYGSAQHLLALTEDVLDLARIGIGRLALAREPVELRQIVDDACGIVRKYIEAKRLGLLVELPTELPNLTLDRLRIRQVLLNLLTNAVRFTDHGSVTVTATIDGGWVVVKVSDTGRGIPSAELSKVFDEFYHTGGDHLRESAEFGGIGLGLPLSKRFIEMHGGMMGVESTVGVGTTFWFSLPTSTVDGPLQDEGARSLRPLRLANDAERVLVLVSADGRLGQFLQRHLRGCRVITTPNLAAATAAAIESRSAAILSDLDATDQTAGRDVPVPLVQLPLPHRERMAAALGVAGYLVKPVSRSDLRTAIARLERPIRRVLIVDDDERFIRLMMRLLHTTPLPADCEIYSAHNGQEALATMENTPPDLLLLDLVMPDLGGREVLEALAANPRLSDIPVIIISAQEQSGDGLRLDGPLSITKPEGFQIEELLGVIDALLGVLEPPRRYLVEDAACRVEPRTMRERQP